MKNIYLLVLFGLILSSCKEYPGHRPNDPVKLMQTPTWGTVNKMNTGGDCHIDIINDKPGEGPKNHIVSKKTRLKIVGWGAISAKDGVTATNIAISLKPESTNTLRFFATTDEIHRPDVAEYFKNPLSLKTGFSSVINLSDVPEGIYTIEVIQHKDGENFRCQATAQLRIDK
jgi:hypothetical protein